MRTRSLFVSMLGALALSLCGACATRDLTPIEDASDASGHSGQVGDSGVPRTDSGTTGVSHDGGDSHHDASGESDSAPATTTCKRGIASNVPPSSAFAKGAASPGISWWYNWSPSEAGDGGAGAAGISFVPMIWGSASLGAVLPKGSAYVLGFNEPNFMAQSDLTPAQAAADWPSVEMSAKAANVPIVSPGVNYCGSPTDTSGCSDRSVTDPYTYLKDFFTDCPGCEVDYIAVHWYNCDLPSLQAYIEGNLDAGGGLQGFVQFGKPIWLTEFSCDGTHSAADQTAYMQAAVPWLEQNAHIFRYSWFSAGAIPSAQLANADGSPTALGTTYISLADSCQ